MLLCLVAIPLNICRKAKRGVEILVLSLVHWCWCLVLRCTILYWCDRWCTIQSSQPPSHQNGPSHMFWFALSAAIIISGINYRCSFPSLGQHGSTIMGEIIMVIRVSPILLIVMTMIMIHDHGQLDDHDDQLDNEQPPVHLWVRPLPLSVKWQFLLCWQAGKSMWWGDINPANPLPQLEHPPRPDDLRRNFSNRLETPATSPYISRLPQNIPARKVMKDLESRGKAVMSFIFALMTYLWNDIIW